MAEQLYAYDPHDLNYLSGKAKPISDTAAVLRVPALGIAGGIAREMTLERNVYPYDLLRRFGQPIKELFTSSEPYWDPSESPASDESRARWRPITHQTIADYFDRSNSAGNAKKPSYFDKLGNPALFDVGPGNIKIRTAINMLQNYNQMFPDSDPLDLKHYNQRYDLLVRDLKDPDSDTTVKIAGLVAREGQDFFVNAMTPERWAALSDDQRAAALTKYYAVGKERMQDDFVRKGGDPNTYTPDFEGDGSNMYMYQPDADRTGSIPPSNPQRLKDAISSGLPQTSPPNTRVNSIDNGGSINLGANAGGQAPSAQAGGSTAGAAQPPPSGVPAHVVANASYLGANGVAITPRTLFVANAVGPQRAVDLIRRALSTSSSQGLPLPDADSNRQAQAWVRALRGAATAPAGQAAAAGAPAPGYATGAAADAPPADTQTWAFPSAASAAAGTDAAADATNGPPQ